MILTPIETAKSEALHNEARTDYSASPQGTGTSLGSDPIGDPFDTSSPSYASTTSGGMSTASAEALGDGRRKSLCRDGILNREKLLSLLNPEH